MTPAIVEFHLVNCWSGCFDSEISCNILHSLDLHIVDVSREIQQIHVRSSREGEVAVEALAGWTIVPSNRKFRLCFVGSLDQVGPVECVAAEREDNIGIEFLISLRESFD